MGVQADSFSEAKQREYERCLSIPASEYSTGLIFNRSGERTMYHRSECLQNLAIRERDGAMCNEVIERESLFFDGSDISKQACRRRVRRKIAQDEANFAAIDFPSIHRLDGVRLARNGNGRDFDLQIRAAGSRPGRYLLIATLLPAGDGEAVLLHQGEYGEEGNDFTLNILIEAETARLAAGPDGWGQTHTMKVEMSPAPDDSNRFYLDRIPLRFRLSSIEIPVNFSALPLWEPEPLQR